MMSDARPETKHPEVDVLEEQRKFSVGYCSLESSKKLSRYAILPLRKADEGREATYF